ncbi:peroxidase family protein [Alsobacter metallidurans]|nr:peroxidase family protein [Alsobacter metallidurans]
MPTIKPFEITLNDVNFLLDQLRRTIKVVGYDAQGRPIYGTEDGAGVHQLGIFGSFDPLTVTVTGLDGLVAPVYLGARDAAGLRVLSGIFNNLTGSTGAPGAWLWGSAEDPFPRLTQAEYDHYIDQVTSNPALDTYKAMHPTYVAVADNAAGYADQMATVIDYTPRMITQTISTSFSGAEAAVGVGAASVSASAAGSTVFGSGELLIVSIGGKQTVFEFVSGAAPAANGDLVFVSSDGTVADVLARIQDGLRAHNLDPNATVGLDQSGAHVQVQLSDPSLGDLTIGDYAGLGLGGSFSPALDASSALLRAGVATDTFHETITNRDGSTEAVSETIVRNQNTLPGDPSTSGIFTLFGQFFDHGLDFIDKGGQGSKVIIPLAVTDPLYRAPGANGPADPGVTTMTISRATPDGYTVLDGHGRQLSIAGQDRIWGTADDLKAPGADGVYGTADDVQGAMTRPAATVYTNHTSPYIDQSQSYGSDEQITSLLREWVKDPNTGTWRPGAQLFDGHKTVAYASSTFNELGSATDGTGRGLTNRTVPTLNELRQHVIDTGRDAITWDDVNNYRERDASGKVLDGDAARTGVQAVYTGQALLLDMNPEFDAAHLRPSDNAMVATSVNAAIDALSASLGAAGTLSWVGDVLTLHLTQPVGPMPVGTYTGAYAMAPWVNFANFSITAPDGALYEATSQILLASVGAHYVAGDGRANENFGLTSLHHVFHENHNVQLVNLESEILQGDVHARHGFQELVVAAPNAAVSGGAHIVGPHYEDALGNTVAANAAGATLVASHFEDANGNYSTASGAIAWDQDKLFNATKVINEMEYQHVAIDQYARLVTPDLPEFVTYDSTINADISLEYAQAAFRFGHSQLRETVDTIDPNGVVTKFALEGAFLNPDQFAKVGAADILRGMSEQVSNEVDEFVTPAMQQALLGQSLDLAAINIARGRDLGVPTLNEARKMLHDALVAERQADPTTPHHSNLIVDALNPYTSWADFGSQMIHPDSLVNFIAAYAFDGDLGKAEALIGLQAGTIANGDPQAEGFQLQDAIEFLNNSYHGTNDALLKGQAAFNDIDLWIGGLAEVHVFGGQLGSTFNAVFEDQMERLMDGDRFYYIYRLQNALAIDTDLGHAVIDEQFKDIIERTTGVLHLNGDVMGYADSYIELGKTFVAGQNLLAYKGEQIHNVTGALVTANQGDIKYEDVGGVWTPIKATAESAHNYGGLIAAYAAAHPGAPVGIYSGPGAGIAGNGSIVTKSNADLGFVDHQYMLDIRPNLGENDDGTANQGFDSHEVLSGTDYDDYIQTGNGDDTDYGDKGNDILDGQGGADHLYGGDGQDVLYGGDISDFLDGGAGDDIVYAGTSSGATDIVIGGAGNDKLYGEAGIDELHGDDGDDYIDAGGDTDLAYGDAGNDIMFGGDGPDELRGGTGSDILSGGSGADVLKGESGDDIMMPGIGQSAQQGDSDEALGDVGFDLVSFQDLNVAFDVPADLRNQNLTAAGGAAPFNPFNVLIADTEGLVGTKFDDKIIGDDNANWLIGGSGSDTFDTRIPDTTGSIGGGGNDVFIGDSLRLDTLIGKYAGYTDGAFDANGNAIHGYLGTLTGGLLDSAALKDAQGAPVFEKHFTELLQTKAFQDFTLGQDTGTKGLADTVNFTGKWSEYTIAAVTYNAGNSDGQVVAYKITDNGGLVDDGQGNQIARTNDGVDLVIGVEYLQFSDRTVSLVNSAPVLDLHAFDTSDVRDSFSTASYANQNGSANWATNWAETGDPTTGNIANTGQIRVASNALEFNDGGAGASIQRSVNLAGATSATLTFDVNQPFANRLGANESVAVQFAADGTNFSTVQTISGTTPGGAISPIALVGPFTANAAVRFAVTGGNSSGGVVRVDNIDVAWTKPADDGGSKDYAVTFTEGGSPVAIALNPSIVDDGTVIHSAKVVLTNMQVGDAFNPHAIQGDNITVTTDNSVAGQITLNLTGDDTLAHYQAQLAAVTFSNGSNSPSAVDRVIHVSVNDGLLDSNVATTTVHVTPVNDAPVAGADRIISNIGNVANGIVVPDWALLANDSDTDGPNPLVISGTSNANSLTAAHGASSVTITDTGLTGGNPNGGSFSYTITDGGTAPNSATAAVTLTQQVGATLTGTNNNDVLMDSGTAHTISGGRGDDIVFAGAGDDTITWTASGSVTHIGPLTIPLVGVDGHDYIDGGLGTDTFVLNSTVTGNDPTAQANANVAEVFDIYTRAAAGTQFGVLNAATEIVVTRNGVVAAELANVEELRINTGQGLDTVNIHGNFDPTHLATSTITVNDADGGDTVNIAELSSSHRIVFNTNVNGHVVGDLRPQDVVNTSESPNGGSGEPTGSNGGSDGGSGDDEHAAGGGQTGGGQTGGQSGGDHAGGADDGSAGAVAALLGTAEADLLVARGDSGTVMGLGGDDLIVGTGGADVIQAGAGDDLVRAGVGDDVVMGGAGNDDLFGGAGKDLVIGDAGDDRLFGDVGDDVLEGGAGHDVVYAGAGNDRIIAQAGDGDDIYWGEAGNDSLDFSAVAANLKVDLGSGVDQHGGVISASGEVDTIFGFENFIGGSGNDVIVANAAVNVLDGGGGQNTFVFHAVADASGDVIKGFQPGDVIDLSGIDANAGVAGKQSFVLFAGTTFTSAGQVILTHETVNGEDHTVLAGSTTGGPEADFKITLVGDHALTAANFHNAP